MITRIGIVLGPITIHFYGVIIMLGALAAAWLAAREIKRRGYSTDIIWDMLPWVLIAGIIGARLWHVLTPPASMVKQGFTSSYYFANPIEILRIWNGGLGIPGAVLGGVIAIYLYTRRKAINFGMVTDSIAPGLALAQAIGRWGNFVNQELYGSPTDLPWGIFIDAAHRLPGYQDVAYYHPLFLYESIYNLINLGILLWFSRRFAERLKDGDLFLLYLVIYPVGRFLLEFLRLDPSPLGTLNINQTIMALIAIAAAIFFYWRHRETETTVQSGQE